MAKEQSLESLPILVVDDIASARKVVTRMLGAQGCKNVVEAGSVKEGLERAKSTPFSIIIADVHLKDGSAVDLIEQLRQSLGDQCPRFVVMTSDLDMETFAKVSGYGITSYLLKPFNPSMFSETLRVCVNGPASR
jgi:CheY-like chemotaxis protein